MAPSQSASSAISVGELAGIGPQKKDQLSRLKIHTADDLLLHRPRRYEDRTHFSKICDAEEGIPTVFRGEITKIQTKRFRGRRGGVVEICIQDDTGELICRWWNQSYIARQYHKGAAVLVYGKPARNKTITIDHPDVENLDDDDSQDDIHVNRIVPIYPLTSGITQRWLRQRIWLTLKELNTDSEPLSGLTPQSSLDRNEALRSLHFPSDIEATDAALDYFVQEELLAFQQRLQERRLRFRERATRRPCANSNKLVSPFLSALPFSLTTAQERVLREIRQDLNAGFPMRRLLQGDVGSGKTVVAAITILMVLESGYDAALLVPTELLARQHDQTLRNWLEPLGIRVDLCTSQEKRTGGTDGPVVTIGTHALLEAGYSPSDLGLVIIDEQHRFGVSQRDRILRKGQYPHLLTMTATPIPRSLGLTVYGDLDHSELNEAPRQRGNVQTYVRRGDRLDKIWEFIGTQLSEGRQAYVIYPRIDATDDDTLKSIDSELERVRQRVPQFQVDTIHGQLNREEATAIMDRFRNGQIQVLVATSVIEVGVDVANATLMLIENAERFGLAQLHQMRGRIGRGQHDSHCVLVAHSENAEAWERLQILESNQDGFAIAEHDLRHRGPGEFLGRQQSGLPRFRFADLLRDRTLVQEIRQRVCRHLGLSASDTNSEQTTRGISSPPQKSQSSDSEKA